MSLNINNRIYLLCLCVIVALVPSCASPLEQSRKRFADERTREFSHPVGAVLRLPESLEARVVPEGFDVIPRDASRRDTRYPIGATVRFHLNKTRPAGEWQQKEIIGERVVWHRVTKNEAVGSGDAEYEFNAWESYLDGYISYQQREQKEFGEPDFSICWRIIDRLSFQRW